MWAPALLILMRFCEGLGVGGEWGGAVLLVVESAPKDKRGYYGSFPQLGVPIGLLLSTRVFALVSSLPEDQFLAWGWRIPFLLSVVLIALGTRFATDITFNVINVFMLAYGTQQLGLSKSLFLNAILIGCAVDLFTLPLFGKLSDRIGRRTVYLTGAVFVALYGFAFYQLVATRDPIYIVFAYIGGMALSQASVYAVQSTWLAELFGTQVRYTGASLPYQLAGIITSGPAPLISAWLFATYQATWPIAGYIAVTAVISLVCAYFLAETFRRNLSEQLADA